MLQHRRPVRHSMLFLLSALSVADSLSVIHRIYAERQTLNMQVMAQLMAAQQNATGGSGDGKATENAQKLRQKLNELLSNLREEQRLESEHHHTIFREIMTPLQVGQSSFIKGRKFTGISLPSCSADHLNKILKVGSVISCSNQEPSSSFCNGKLLSRK